MTRGSLCLHLNIQIDEFLTKRADAQMSFLGNEQKNDLLSLITSRPPTLHPDHMRKSNEVENPSR